MRLRLCTLAIAAVLPVIAFAQTPPPPPAAVIPTVPATPPPAGTPAVPTPKFTFGGLVDT